MYTCAKLGGPYREGCVGARPNPYVPIDPAELLLSDVMKRIKGDRHQVHALYKVGLRKCAIVEQIGVHKSTICREIHRDKCLHRYGPKQAPRLAFSRQAQIPRTRILDGIWTEIEKMIREDRSPEQINGHLSDYQYFSKHC